MRGLPSGRPFRFARLDFSARGFIVAAAAHRAGRLGGIAVRKVCIVGISGKLGRYMAEHCLRAATRWQG
jgi:hypothetical protein